ncbi:MAG: TlyA family RNA methyltransferase [Chloroflexota bacterium]|nr:TlyA family RNA methyltransferase [Dehalococcoidia bacterium]MDW8253573.1 TlyA family RNA methyltransferase [Chloroflexota bacterium]
MSAGATRARKERERVDRLLVARGLAPTREKAQALILAGEVVADGAVVTSAGTLLPRDAQLTVVAPPPYVSRGGQKLAGALAAFPIDPAGRVCADVGASTGGFTDVLLQRGAAKVYAIDVGYGQLAPTLRADPRVVVLERTNARALHALPEPVSLVTIDVSFISLTKILPAVRHWLAPTADIIALVKPQFEVGPRQVGKGGVVRDPQARAGAVVAVAEAARSLGLRVRGVCPSPLPGPAGNRELFLWLATPEAPELPAVPEAARRAAEREEAVIA